MEVREIMFVKLLDCVFLAAGDGSDCGLFEWIPINWSKARLAFLGIATLAFL